jgi:hypothetical protein
MLHILLICNIVPNKKRKGDSHESVMTDGGAFLIIRPRSASFTYSIARCTELIIQTFHKTHMGFSCFISPAKQKGKIDMNTFPIKDVFVSQFRIADISCTKSAS